MIGTSTLPLFTLLALAGLALPILALCCYRKAASGTALVRTGIGGPRVSLNGLFASPLLHRVHVLDLAPRRITVERMREPRHWSSDGQAVDVKVVFQASPGRTTADMVEASCDERGRFNGTNEKFTVLEHRCALAVGEVVSQHPFDELYHDTESLKARLLEHVGSDLGGLVIDSVAIDHLAKPMPRAVRGAAPTQTLLERTYRYATATGFIRG
ncbi:MAG: hypothetical protein KDA42_11920 [Planctomycetales bacterium]|nr:hypothetical protein [Planctomycetales bacterium]